MIWSAAGSLAAASLASSSGPALAMALYKVPFPPGRHLEGISLLFCLGSHHGEGSSISDWLRPVVVGVIPSLASVAPARADLLSARQPLGKLCLHRPALVLLGESPAGCWRSRPFERSRSFCAEAVGTPRTPTGILFGPWYAP
jgi:hypothetical protein